MNSQCSFGIIAVTLLIALPMTLHAGTPGQNSNIGLKLALGTGNQSPSNAQNLQKGGFTSLSLGYGITQTLSLWLGAGASENYDKDIPDYKSTIAGVELGLQYKMRPYQKLRPYGRVGLGGFVRHDNTPDVSFAGGGVTWALGGEYRLARFLTVGAEFFWKDIDYSERQVGEGDFVELDQPVHGNTNGFLVTFTLH